MRQDSDKTARPRRRLRHEPIGQRERLAERQVRALELRRDGYTYRAIAAELGCTAAQAHIAVKAKLAEIAAQSEEVGTEVRALELERLDGLWRSAWPRAEAGDDAATRSCLAIQARRAALLGLDAPERRELSGPGGAPLSVAVLDAIVRDADG